MRHGTVRSSRQRYNAPVPGGAPVAVSLSFLVLTRSGQRLCLVAAVALLLWLNAWWVLWLLDLHPPHAESLPLLWPSSPLVMVAGHVVALLLLLGALGVFSPRPGSPAHLALLAARRGDHLAAGEFWLEAGRRRRALAAFVRAKAYERAAEVARSMGKFTKAARLLQLRGDASLGGAAQLYHRLGDQERAKALWLRQAQQYVEAGQYELAVEPFVKAGDARRAAHAAELALQARRLPPALVELALRASRDARRPQLAAQIALVGGRFHEAGDLFLAADMPEEAAQAFERAGEPLRAAEALRLAGRVEEAARLRARHLESSGKFQLAAAEYESSGLVAEAAAALAASGEWEEAIKRFQQAGRLREAAAIAFEHGDPRLAASLFGELGEWERAGEAWERAEDPVEAARCFERAGDYARALDVLHRHGRVVDEAQLLARLGRVEEGFLALFEHGDLRGAWELLAAYAGTFPHLAPQLVTLARWLEANGEPAAAISAVQRATAGHPMSRDLLPAWYTLALLLERRGDLRAAEGALEKIVEFDYGYEDAAGRLQDVAAKRAAAEAASQRAAMGEGGEEALTDPAMRYVLGELIGRGGMGAVYRAQDTRLGRTIAVKILNPKQHSAETIRRFEREARAAAALSHPGIVHVYDFDRGFDSYFIAMELVQGPTLSQLVREEPAFVRDAFFLLAGQILDAVAYAHEHHVIHRDLKPANMVFADRRQIKILDFGIARRLDEADASVTGATGTPFYMAPEQILGDEASEQSDIYSLGVTFFQLLTGSLPFPGGNVLRAHLEQPAPDPRALLPDLDPELALLILRCLEKRPEHRPASARELLQALAAIGERQR